MSMAEEQDTREVFSDIYAVLNKNWKENHHDRLCEILADVERECEVEISFVKGAYQFRGTLTALSNVLKSLTCGSGGDRNLSSVTSGDDAQRHALQSGELLGSKDAGPYSVVVYSNSDEVQPQSWNEGKVGSLLLCSSEPGGQSAAGHDSLSILTSEDKPAEQSTQHETEHIEQMENLSIDHVVTDNSSKSLHSIPGAPLSHECDSTQQVKAEADEENCESMQHQDNTALPEPDPSLLQMKENCKALPKRASTKHSVVDVTNEPDKSSDIAKDGKSGLEASHTSFPPRHSVTTSTDKHTSGLDTEMSAVSESSAATPTVDRVVRNNCRGEMPASRKELIYARDLIHSYTDS